MRRSIKKSPLKARNRNRIFMGLFHKDCDKTAVPERPLLPGPGSGILNKRQIDKIEL